MLDLTPWCGDHCGQHESGALAHCSRCHGGNTGHDHPMRTGAKVIPLRRRARR